MFFRMGLCTEQFYAVIHTLFPCFLQLGDVKVVTRKNFAHE